MLVWSNSFFGGLVPNSQSGSARYDEHHESWTPKSSAVYAISITVFPVIFLAWSIAESICSQMDTPGNERNPGCLCLAEVGTRQRGPAKPWKTTAEECGRMDFGWICIATNCIWLTALSGQCGIFKLIHNCTHGFRKTLILRSITSLSTVGLAYRHPQIDIVFKIHVDKKRIIFSIFVI